VEAANARWLGLLFTETLALLVLQLVLGWMSGSLSLIADAPHSAVDVVTYGFAYWAEIAKMRLASGAAAAGNTVGGRKCFQGWSSHRLDATGAGFGLFALLGASFFVAQEATNRLRHGHHINSDKDSQPMGSAMLTFSVISTAGNVGVLYMFKRGQRPASSAALPRSPVELAGLAEAEIGDESPPPAALCRHGGKCKPPCRARLAAGERFKRLCATTPNKLSDDCQASCCSDPAVPGKAQSAWPTLHELLHPGCAHKGECGSKQGKNGSSSHAHSLNTSSAMLHLVSDVLRGITIFAVAVLMKLHAVTNTARADAACALFVAALVVLGSGAMLTEVVRALFGWSGEEDDGI